MHKQKKRLKYFAFVSYTTMDGHYHDDWRSFEASDDREAREYWRKHYLCSGESNLSVATPDGQGRLIATAYNFQEE